jgi:hypothetical protein
MCSYTRYPHLAAKPRPLLPPDVGTQKKQLQIVPYSYMRCLSVDMRDTVVPYFKAGQWC